MSSGLFSFSPQGPRGRRDHQGLQGPQAPKVTGARQERKAQQDLPVRTLTLSFVRWGLGAGLLPYPSRRSIPCTSCSRWGEWFPPGGDARLTSSQQHPDCCPSRALGCRKKRTLWELRVPVLEWGCQELGVVVSHLNNTPREPQTPPGSCSGVTPGQPGWHPWCSCPRAEIP